MDWSAKPLIQARRKVSSREPSTKVSTEPGVRSVAIYFCIRSSVLE